MNNTVENDIAEEDIAIEREHWASIAEEQASGYERLKLFPTARALRALARQIRGVAAGSLPSGADASAT